MGGPGGPRCTPGYYNNEGQPRGGHLRTLDKNVGEVLGQIAVDRSLHGAPMTYMHKGR